jgi:glutathione S-transferase
MLTLYVAPGSSSFAVHIALHEIGVPFEGRPMSFEGNDMRSPTYLALNAEGKVPTLIIDGRPLTEVAAILYYLAKRFPDAGLLPRDDIEADAQALSWMSFAASTLHLARKRGLDYASEVWGLPIGGWAAAGRSAAIRSPTSICFGSIGGSPIRSSPRLKAFPISPRIMRG